MSKSNGGEPLWMYFLDGLRNGRSEKEMLEEHNSSSSLDKAKKIFSAELTVKIENQSRRSAELEAEINAKEKRLGDLSRKVEEVEAIFAEAERRRDASEKAAGEAEVKVSGLDAKKLELETKVADIERWLQEYSASESELKSFLATRVSLLDFKLNIEDASTVNRIFRNLEKMNFDSEDIAFEFKRSEDLLLENLSLYGTNNRLKEKNEELAGFIADKSGLVDKIRYLEALQVGEREVGAVIEAALRSAALRGYSTAEALAAMTIDFGENYGVTRSLREEVESLARRKRTLLEEIKADESELDTQKMILKEGEAILTAKRWINQQGCPDEDIVEIRGTMVEYGGDVPGFVAEVKKLGGLKELVKSKSKTYNELLARIEALSKEKAEKEEQVSALGDRITQWGNYLESRIKVIIDKLEEKAKQADSGFKKIVDKYEDTISIDAAGGAADIQIAVGEFRKEVADEAKRQRGQIQLVVDDVSKVRDASMEAVVETAKLEGLHEIAALMAGGSVDDTWLTLMIRRILENARAEYVRFGLTEHVRVINDALRGLKRLDEQVQL